MNPLKTFFYSLKKSLFEPKYYKEIAKTNFWFSYKYLLFLLFIFVFFRSLTVGALYLKNRPHIKPGIDKFMNYAQTFYPKELELRMRNNQLSTNVKEPYIFDLKRDTKDFAPGSRHLLIIDTKGSIENYPNYDTYVLATKNAVVYPSKARNSDIEQTSVFYFRDLKQDFTMNKNVYNDFLKLIKPYTNRALLLIDSFVLAGLFLFLVFGSLFWASSVMFGLLFLTFFTWIVNLIFKKKYSYGALFKIGMHAVTWPIIISETLNYLGFVIPGVYAIIFFIFIFVILFS
ncbi:DUF1189 family protein [Candidatus Roizmanbacteria bacterium]|nr:DUF1189 family protein [Candidatus Roizmanbacteria bacterium]